jgi:hypothetical protein
MTIVFIHIVEIYYKYALIAIVSKFLFRCYLFPCDSYLLFYLLLLAITTF